MAEHPHGTLNRYVSGRCRCQPCRDAKSAYARHRNRQLAYGRWEGYVDAWPCRVHVQGLLDAGVTLGRIAVLAGLSASTVKRLMQGIPRSGGVRAERVRAETAEALLNVRADLDGLQDTAWIDSTGTRRRIQALAALGYSLKEQAEAIGRHATNFRLVLARETVLVGTARMVRDLYSAWSMTPAPATWMADRTRRRAASQGWLPPLAWDDLIDLPDGELEEELRRRVALMDRYELQQCSEAAYRHGDKSPLVVAAAREFEKRKFARRGTKAAS
jgi:hypothetical protein